MWLGIPSSSGTGPDRLAFVWPQEAPLRPRPNTSPGCALVPHFSAQEFELSMSWLLGGTPVGREDEDEVC